MRNAGCCSAAPGAPARAPFRPAHNRAARENSNRPSRDAPRPSPGARRSAVSRRDLTARPPRGRRIEVEKIEQIVRPRGVAVGQDKSRDRAPWLHRGAGSPAETYFRVGRVEYSSRPIPSPGDKGRRRRGRVVGCSSISAFSCGEMVALQLRHDRLRDLALDRENIRQVAIVSVRPELPVRRGHRSSAR